MSRQYSLTLRKCSICGDEWEIDSLEWSSCECGKNCFKDNSYMTSEGRGNNSTHIKTLKSYFYEDRIFVVSKELQDRMEKIKQITKDSYYKGHCYISKEKYSEKEIDFIESFNFSVYDVGHMSGYENTSFEESLNFRYGNEITLEYVEKVILGIERLLRYSDRFFEGDISDAINSIVKRNKDNLYWREDTREVKDCCFSIV